MENFEKQSVQDEKGEGTLGRIRDALASPEMTPKKVAAIMAAAGLLMPLMSVNMEDGGKVLDYVTDKLGTGKVSPAAPAWSMHLSPFMSANSTIGFEYSYRAHDPSAYDSYTNVPAHTYDDSLQKTAHDVQQLLDEYIAEVHVENGVVKLVKTKRLLNESDYGKIQEALRFINENPKVFEEMSLEEK